MNVINFNSMSVFRCFSWSLLSTFYGILVVIFDESIIWCF